MFLTSNKNRKSTDLEGTPNPKLGQKQNGAKTPKSGLKMQTPKANFKPGTPKSNEKKKFPKNGARKALVVNGSPKVEGETVVKAEANSPAKKNRKRSLSEPGGESAAKTAKLEKSAGAASLTTEKTKKPKNRSAKRHEQNKEKKRTIAKTNKSEIKAKIVAGDIEALREIQTKLDELIAKPVSERSKSARRRIRQFQSWVSIKSKKDGTALPAAAKGRKQKPGQKKNQQKGKNELAKTKQQSAEEISAGTKKTQKPAQKKNQQVIPKELEMTDDASNESDDDVSNEEGDIEMQSAGSDEDVAEEGSDEEDSDIDDDDDEEDSDDEEVASEFVVDAKGKKPNQKPVNSKPQAQNKGKGFGKPGNNKFAGRQRKGPQKK